MERERTGWQMSPENKREERDGSRNTTGVGIGHGEGGPDDLEEREKVGQRMGVYIYTSKYHPGLDNVPFSSPHSMKYNTKVSHREEQSISPFFSRQFLSSYIHTYNERSSLIYLFHRYFP